MSGEMGETKTTRPVACRELIPACLKVVPPPLGEKKEGSFQKRFLVLDFSSLGPFFVARPTYLCVTAAVYLRHFVIFLYPLGIEESVEIFLWKRLLMAL